MERPLWKLLLVFKNEYMLAERPLTCSECFTILEYLAESFAQKKQQTDVQLIRKELKEHLDSCPDCHDFYQQQLKELEASLS